MEARQKIKYEKLTTDYEFPVAGFQADSDKVNDYLAAVEDRNDIYRRCDIVPPMAIAALAMKAMAANLDFPDGAIHVSQGFAFHKAAKTGESLTGHARVIKKQERSGMRILTIGIDVIDNEKATIMTGETCFMLPRILTEAKQ